jgi:hypothetical protein
MKHRKLRIAWSVAWGIAVVLLVALWGRSYRWIDGIAYDGTGTIYVCMTLHGHIMLFCNLDDAKGNGWGFQSKRVEESLPDLSAVPSILGVNYDLRANTPYVLIPLWELVLIFAGFGTVPWMRWTRRFSVRTLLIATTLVAVGLGLIVWLRSIH